MKKVVNYFYKIGYEIPKYTNPADFLMKLMNPEVILKKIKSFKI